MSQFVTGEAVALDLRPAGLASRILAALIDVTIQVVLAISLFALISAAAASSSEAASSAYALASYVIILFGYPVAFETLLRGRTPGKMAIGLRVVRDDAGPISFRQALVRGLLGAFVERPGFTSGSAAIICSLVSDKGKRIGDVLAGTMVIQERVPRQSGPVAVMPPPLAAWAASLDLLGLPNELALSVRTFLSRSSDLTEAARTDLGNRLTAAVLAVVTPAPPAGAPGWAILSAVLAERRRREELRLTSNLPPVRTSAPGGSPAWAQTGPAAPSVTPPPVGEPPVPGPGGFVLPG